jgi:hypothetical protein
LANFKAKVLMRPGIEYCLTYGCLQLYRMDRTQHAWMVNVGALCAAPVHKPRSILEIGTGTGAWLQVSMADCLSRVCMNNLIYWCICVL